MMSSPEIEIDPSIGRMVARNFHKLETLDSASSRDKLPPKLLNGDAIGGRIYYPEDNPRTIVIGRLAFYLCNEAGEWTALPFDSIISTDYDNDKELRPTRLDIITIGGRVSRLRTSEIAGLLGVILRKAKNYELDV